MLDQSLSMAGDSMGVAAPVDTPPPALSRGFRSAALPPGTVERAAAGDRGAQAELYRAYGGAVYTLARRMTGRTTIAEEVLQDTFVEILTRLESLREPGAVGGWIRAIAVNNVLMSLRAGRWLVPLERMLVAPAGDLVPHDLQQLLDRLPDLARAVVWLHEVEGYTHDEIGALLGRTASFSKSQLARAYQRLRVIAAGCAALEKEQCMQRSSS